MFLYTYREYTSPQEMKRGGLPADNKNNKIMIFHSLIIKLS